MTIRYRARDLAAMDPQVLWAIADGPVEVEFDPLPDGTPQVLATDSRPTIFSAYMWRLYVEYPKTPAKISHHQGPARLTDNSHSKLLNAVMWDCYDAYQGEVDLEEISKILYESTNAWFNAVVSRPELEREVSTISIEDLIDVTEEPRIAAAIAAINGSPGSIAKAHQVAEEVLNDPEALVGNPVSASVRSKLVSMAQIKQTMIARGPVTDIDERYFAEAIPSSFLSGMNSVIESMMESRSSTKAAAYKEKPIQDSEYFNRRLQLLAATIQHVEYICQQTSESTAGIQLLPGDCGSKRYLRWTVKGSDLRAMEGKYYVLGDRLAVIKESDTHLIGATLQLRSPALCMHEAAQSVCATCYGDLALSLPRGSNIGHVAAVVYGERVTQSMLGIKHVDFTTGSRLVVLGPYEKEFLSVIPDTRGVKLLPKYIKQEVMLSVAASDVAQLNEINFVDDVSTLPAWRVSEIGELYMTLTHPVTGEKDTIQLNMDVAGKKSYFTHALLAHIKRHGYTLSDTGRYLISLEGFDRELPIFEVPNKNENIMDYLNSIIRFISSTEEKDAKKGVPEGPRRMLKHCRSLEEALVAFHELTKVRMVVNLVHLEILVYATMIRSAKHRDYRLPHPQNALIFGQLARLISNRSLSAAMAFQNHSDTLTEAGTYINFQRTDHPLDDLLVPKNAAM